MFVSHDRNRARYRDLDEKILVLSERKCISLFMSVTIYWVYYTYIYILYYYIYINIHTCIAKFSVVIHNYTRSIVFGHPKYYILYSWIYKYIYVS